MTENSSPNSGRFAVLVGAGIMLSRLTGLVREMAINRWLGVGTLGGEAFTAALQIPKVLQNLLGEGSLSASFVPVYSQQIGVDEDEARSLAGGVLGLLIAAVAGLVLLVVVLAEPIVWLVARGFAPEKQALTVDLLRVMAPGIGAIVLAAWCLGVLNAHRRFFLSYVAPVLWNAAIVVAVALAARGDRSLADIARWAAWGVFVGGVLQFVVQLPTVWKVAGAIRPSFRMTDGVRAVVRRFVPAVSGRGVVTLATYLDLFLASFLVTGALRIIASAQVFYLLPISVFAMSIAAADLPELSREQGAIDVARERVHTGIERIAFFIVFSAVAFVVAGKPLIEALSGLVETDQAIAVWLTLAAYSLGLVASGISRLLQNASFAAGDVKGPARIVAIRVAVSVAVGVVLMLQLDRLQVTGSTIERVGDLPAFGPVGDSLRSVEGIVHLGAVGLALGASVAAWLELWLLRRRLGPVYGNLGISAALRRLAPGAIAAGIIGGVLAWALDGLPALITAGIAIGLAGLVYVGLALAAKSATATSLLGSLRR